MTQLNKPRRSRPNPLKWRAFTLIELIVVITIIVLVLGIVLPVVNTLTSNRGLANAQNQVAAYIATARGDAIQFQQPIGVCFYLDPVNHQTTMCEVQIIQITDGQSGPNMVNGAWNYWLGPLNWIDVAGDRASGVLLPYRETMSLPANVGIGLCNSPYTFNSAGQSNSANYNDTKGDSLFHWATDQIVRMGVIMFDQNGNLICLDYGIPAKNLLPINSALGAKVKPSGGYIAATAENQYGPGGSTISSSAFVLYDRDVYFGQSTSNPSGNGTVGMAFNDADLFYRPSWVAVGYGPVVPATLSAPGTTTQSAPNKIEEENWIMSNGISLTVNPINGTLIKAK